MAQMIQKIKNRNVPFNVNACPYKKFERPYKTIEHHHIAFCTKMKGG